MQLSDAVVDVCQLDLVWTRADVFQGVIMRHIQVQLQDAFLDVFGWNVSWSLVDVFQDVCTSLT